MPTDLAWAHASDNHNLHISQTFDGSSNLPTLQSSQSHAINPLTPTPASCVPDTQTGITLKPAGRSVELGDGTVITVDDVTRIAVPATSFAENIERLNQMWDDTSAYWKNDSVVTISNHSIALIYWPEIFKKTGLWSTHKSNWTEWKVSL
jgi:hypothetical protein